MRCDRLRDTCRGRHAAVACKYNPRLIFRPLAFNYMVDAQKTFLVVTIHKCKNIDLARRFRVWVFDVASLSNSETSFMEFLRYLKFERVSLVLKPFPNAFV